MTRLTSRPHLIHIGFPKAASTFLQHWFDRHPEIAYRPGGLAGMHTVYDLVEAVLDQDSRYRCRVTSDERLVAPEAERMVLARAERWRTDSDPADHSDGTQGFEAVAHLLQKMFPDASILIVSRGFDDFFKSAFSQVTKEGVPISSDVFAATVADDTTGIMSLDYDEIIALYEQLFPGRVLVLPYEMLVENRHAFLGRIEEMLGVSPFDPGEVRLNTSLSGEQLYWYPRIAKCIHRIPVRPIRRALGWLHVAMISRGAWKPVLLALRLFFGKRSAGVEASAELIEKLSANARKMVEREEFARFRHCYVAD